MALVRPGIVQNDAIVPDGCEVAIDRPGRADRAGSGAARPNISVAIGVARGGRSIIIGIICSSRSKTDIPVNRAVDHRRCAALAIYADRTSDAAIRSEEHTSELQSLMRISYAVFCLKKKTQK